MFTKWKNACILLLIIDFCIVGFAPTAHGNRTGAGTGKKIKSQLVETKLKSAIESVLCCPACVMQLIRCSKTVDGFEPVFYVGSESAYSYCKRIYHQFKVVL